MPRLNSHNGGGGGGGGGGPAPLRPGDMIRLLGRRLKESRRDKRRSRCSSSVSSEDDNWFGASEEEAEQLRQQFCSMSTAMDKEDEKMRRAREHIKALRAKGYDKEARDHETWLQRYRTGDVATGRVYSTNQNPAESCVAMKVSPPYKPPVSLLGEQGHWRDNLAVAAH